MHIAEQANLHKYCYIIIIIIIINFSCLWAKGIPAGVFPSKRRFPVNAGKKSSALFLYQNV